jgi:hypothetical protein
MPKIHRDIAFPSILLMVVARDAAALNSPVAGNVTLWWLEFHNVSAQVTQHASRKWPS